MYKVMRNELNTESVVAANNVNGLSGTQSDAIPQAFSPQRTKKRYEVNFTEFCEEKHFCTLQKCGRRHHHHHLCKYNRYLAPCYWVNMGTAVGTMFGVPTGPGKS